MRNPDAERLTVQSQEICTDAEWDDPIVREVREIRAQIFARFNDLAAYVRYLGERQEEARQQGHVIISTPFARTQPPQGPARTDAA
ncbi:MAG: hypothetical protein AVDCRST_MAG89-5103 [uncultured Gemmatimonadetes bacterium]|uniref:Uncharacterized protein n=1 Tax=uncultured Gemmatimonadota bacterium TaxID=203437 RepID=A0A6J4N3Y5_9BACT|nr:MAG: hypothetical protein AVDCRST_MAG89-5103 [uncultured Gemmatimonadota bacterium]